MNPTQFFMNLAGGDNFKYEEIINFSRNILNKSLPSCVQIYGDGSNGKTTLIKLLARIGNLNCGFASSCMIDEVAKTTSGSDQSFTRSLYGEAQKDVDYIIVEDYCSYKLLQTPTKFIFISNNHSLPVGMNHLHLNAKLESSDIGSLLWLDEAKCLEFRSFLMA